MQAIGRPRQILEILGQCATSQTFNFNAGVSLVCAFEALLEIKKGKS
jgi:hypothetical protein